MNIFYDYKSLTFIDGRLPSAEDLQALNDLRYDNGLRIGPSIACERHLTGFANTFTCDYKLTDDELKVLELELI